MFAVLLLPTILLAAVAVSLMAVHSSRGGVFAPVIDPDVANDTAETLAGSTGMMTVLNPPPTDWQMATLHSLAEVEDLLDSLEAHGIASREVTAVNNTTFTVRWK